MKCVENSSRLRPIENQFHDHIITIKSENTIAFYKAGQITALISEFQTIYYMKIL